MGKERERILETISNAFFCSNLFTDTIPECAPVSKSSSIESTESLAPILEDTTTDDMQKPMAPQEESSLTSTHRRVIFPSLHPSPSSSMNKINQGSNDSKLLRKFPSFDSVTNVGMSHSPLPTTSKDEEESSPKCVTLLDDCIPAMPRLGIGAATVTSSSRLQPSPGTTDPSALVIPPFKRSTTPPELVVETQNVEIDTPSYKKRTFTPYKNLTLVPAQFMHGLMNLTTRDSSSPAVLTSILRNSKKDQPEPLDDSPLKRVAFDARVWVSEFTRDPVERSVTWYSPAEMERFKRNAMNRVCSFAELVPSGTGRIVRRPVHQKATFSNPALLGDEDEDEFAIQRLARLELGNILVVDPHDLCARLFVKALKHMLPHATVATASSSDDALKRIESSNRRFDLIIVEERLKLLPHAEEYQVSGSAFVKRLAEASKEVPESRQPLFIGVSAHFKKDQARLEESGAAFTWPKPPPKLDRAMRDKLLKHILLTRGKDQSALKYFH